MMSRARPEQIIQRAVFDHLRARAARGVFAFHVPNGGYRKPIEAGQPALSAYASPPPSRERQPAALSGARLPVSAAVATSREGHRSPRSDQEGQHRRWGRGQPQEQKPE